MEICRQSYSRYKAISRNLCFFCISFQEMLILVSFLIILFVCSFFSMMEKTFIFTLDDLVVIYLIFYFVVSISGVDIMRFTTTIVDKLNSDLTGK